MDGRAKAFASPVKSFVQFNICDDLVASIHFSVVQEMWLAITRMRSFIVVASRIEVERVFSGIT
jgi:hypothetical protein